MATFNTRLAEHIASLDARLDVLNTQIRRADEILAEMGAAQDQMEILDSDDEFEHDYYIDSSDDEEDDGTVAYVTPVEVMMDSDDDSDTDTVVGQWEDPFLTPDRVYRLLIPDNLEDGLEFLNGL